MKKTFKVLIFFFLAFYFLLSNYSLAQDLNNFYISDYEVDIYLSRDAENHSKITTVEKIVAVFPDFDQNRGITRDFVKGYNGHDTELTLISVTDENGVPIDEGLNDAIRTPLFCYAGGFSGGGGGGGGVGGA